MQAEGGVLAVTGLSPDARWSLELAGLIAERCGIGMDVLYALGLRGMTLRKAVPELLDLDQRIASIDRSVRELVREIFPHWERVTGPVIDVDNVPAALVRRAAQLQPDVVVLPSNWNRDPAAASRADSVSVIAAVRAPVMVADTCQRIPGAVLLATPALLSPSLLQTARAWVLWLQTICGDRYEPGETGLDVVFVEDVTPRLQIPSLEAHDSPLVLIPRTALNEPYGSAMHATVSSLLVQRTARVLILPEAAPPLLVSQATVGMSQPIAAEA